MEIEEWKTLFNIDREKQAPKIIQEKLKQLSSTNDLAKKDLYFEKSNIKPTEGDIFVIQVQKNIYLYGRVISTNVKLYDSLNQIQPTCVIFLYKKITRVIEMPSEKLDYDNLLLRPQLETNYFFNSGLAKIIGNITLSEDEKNIDLGFYNQYRQYWYIKHNNSIIENFKELEDKYKENWRNNPDIEFKFREFDDRFYDLDKNVLTKMPQYCGILEIKGLRIIYDIAKELILDPSLIGVEYNISIPEKKKLPVVTVLYKGDKIESIEIIVNSMISFQKECKEYKGNIKNGIKAFSEISYEFLINSNDLNDEKSYLETVKQYVKKINQINDYTDNQLIETDERESICELIDEITKKLNFSFNYDITEKYREW